MLSSDPNRVGLGSMQLTGPGHWAAPDDLEQAMQVLRDAVEADVTHIDTADAYVPFTAEKYIRKALHPYPVGLVIATKGGLTQDLSQLLVAAGEEVHVTAEPSTGPIGTLCRELTETTTGHALACLYAADRYQHLEAEVRPNTEAGRVVLSDRYIPSGLDDVDRPALEATKPQAQAAGTPFISFYTPHEMLALAGDTGFEDVRHVSGTVLAERYFADRTDGLRPSSGEDLLVATT